MRWNYYKLRQLSLLQSKCDGLLLQIVTPFLLQRATRFITNYDMALQSAMDLSQIATVQTSR